MRLGFASYFFFLRTVYAPEGTRAPSLRLGINSGSQAKGKLPHHLLSPYPIIQRFLFLYRMSISVILIKLSKFLSAGFIRNIHRHSLSSKIIHAYLVFPHIFCLIQIHICFFNHIINIKRCFFCKFLLSHTNTY